MGRQLVQVYRTAEDYHRYTWANDERREAMQAFVRSYRRYIGRRVLDLGCGGGVLGRVLEPMGRSYVGVDANPDMIREARKDARARGSRQRFLLGDVATVRLPGRFDTVALIGNTLGHLDVEDVDRILVRLRGHVRPRATLLFEYRDLVGLLWQGKWAKVVVQTFVRGKVTHRTQRLDVEHGRLEMRARPSSGRWVLDWTHAIWSPFILEGLMRAHGWRLAGRWPVPVQGKGAIPEKYVEAYRFVGLGARDSA